MTPQPNFEKILRIFEQRGGERYGSEGVSQLEHALQCAQLAVQEQAPARLVAAALLHDLGHLLDTGDLPHDVAANLDDHHETKAAEFLRSEFGEAVSEPIRLHVVAKRYLCTIQPEYAGQLSPTSYKSFLDQGGKMSRSELEAFEAEPYRTEALLLRRWDDLGKQVAHVTPPIEHFLPHLAEAHVTSGVK